MKCFVWKSSLQFLCFFVATNFWLVVQIEKRLRCREVAEKFYTKSNAESFTVELNDLNPAARTRAIKMDPTSDPTASPFARPRLGNVIMREEGYSPEEIELWVVPSV